MENKGRLTAVLGVVGAVVAVSTLLFGEGLLRPGADDGGDQPSVSAQPVAAPVPTTAPSPSSPAETASAESPEPDTGDVPERFQGDWNGMQTQAGTGTYPVQLSLTSGAIGDVVGTLVFPGLGCEFRLVLAGRSVDYLDLQTSLVTGPCVDAVLRTGTDGATLAYSSFTQGVHIANGQLTRS